MRDAKNSPSGQHRTTLSGYIFATKAHIDNWKKNLLAAISPPHVPTIWWTYTSAEIVSLVLGTPANFSQVSRLGSVTARHLVLGVSQSLRRWTEGTTYVRQGDHHVGHSPTFLVVCCFEQKVRAWSQGEDTTAWRGDVLAVSRSWTQHNAAGSWCYFDWLV